MLVAMENFEKCTVAMLGGPCSQHVTGNTSRQNQPQSAKSICTPVDDNSSCVHIFTHLMKHTTGVTDICTSTCYLTNMYQLHKFDLDNKAPRPFCLLLLSGDIATNPGPAGESMFPCAVCQYGVNWSHKAVACDNYSIWIHKTCASMDSVT